MRPAKRRLDAPHPAPAFPRILRTTVADWVRALQAEGAVRRATALRSIGIGLPCGRGAGDRGRGTVAPAGTVV